MGYRAAILLMIFLAAAPAAVFSSDAPKAKVTQATSFAIDQALNFLRERQKKNGDWENSVDFYFLSNHFFASFLYHQMGPEIWDKYYERTRTNLLKLQKSGGNWNNDALKTARLSTAYQTAMAALILSVPTEYLPIYQR